MATLTKDFSLTLSLLFPPHLLTLSLTYHTSITPVEMFEEAQCELVLLPPHKDPRQVAEVRFRCLQKSKHRHLKSILSWRDNLFFGEANSSIWDWKTIGRKAIAKCYWHYLIKLRLYNHPLIYTDKGARKFSSNAFWKQVMEQLKAPCRKFTLNLRSCLVTTDILNPNKESPNTCSLLNSHVVDPMCKR